MTKKIALVGLFFLLCSSVLMACNSGSEPAEGNADQQPNQQSDEEEGGLSGEITVWVHPYTDDKVTMDQVWDQMKTSFEEQYPETTINIEEIPWQNRSQKILTALAANQGPDVLYMTPDLVAKFAHEGILEPITSFVDEEFLSDFRQSALDATSYDGNLYGLPILQQVASHYYNLEIVEEIGGDPDNLPKNWEEFKELGEKAVEAGYFATSFNATGINNNFMSYLWQAGGDAVDRDGNVLLDTPESIDAFAFINELYKGEMIPLDSGNPTNDQEAMFVKGEMMSLMATQRFIASQGDNPLEFDWAIGPTLQDKAQVTYGTTGVFGVAANSDNKATAAEFLKHMTNTENQKLFNKATLYIPTRNSAGDLYNDNPEMEIVVEQAEFVRSEVTHPVVSEMYTPMTAELQSMLSGKKSPEEAAKAAANEIRAILEREGF